MNVNKLLKLDNGLNLSGDFNFLNKYDNNSYIYSKLEMNNGRDNAYMKLDASTCSITLSGPNSGITINSRKITSFAGIENVTDTSNNIRIGTDVLSINRGNNNTAIGYQTLYYNETGGANTAIGYNAGYYAGSSYNTFLGSYTDISGNATNIQYSTAVGSGAKIDVSNQIVLGTSNERVDIPGKLFVNNVEITSSGGGGEGGSLSLNPETIDYLVGEFDILTNPRVVEYPKFNISLFSEFDFKITQRGLDEARLDDNISDDITEAALKQLLVNGLYYLERLIILTQIIKVVTM
jgi:hypothetical protein